MATGKDCIVNSLEKSINEVIELRGIKKIKKGAKKEFKKEKKAAGLTKKEMKKVEKEEPEKEEKKRLRKIRKEEYKREIGVAGKEKKAEIERYKRTKLFKKKGTEGIRRLVGSQKTRIEPININKMSWSKLSKGIRDTTLRSAVTQIRKQIEAFNAAVEIYNDKVEAIGRKKGFFRKEPVLLAKEKVFNPKTKKWEFPKKESEFQLKKLPEDNIDEASFLDKPTEKEKELAAIQREKAKAGAYQRKKYLRRPGEEEMIEMIPEIQKMYKDLQSKKDALKSQMKTLIKLINSKVTERDREALIQKIKDVFKNAGESAEFLLITLGEKAEKAGKIGKRFVGKTTEMGKGVVGKIKGIVAKHKLKKEYKKQGKVKMLPPPGQRNENWKEKVSQYL